MCPVYKVPYLTVVCHRLSQSSSDVGGISLFYTKAGVKNIRVSAGIRTLSKGWTSVTCSLGVRISTVSLTVIGICLFVADVRDSVIFKA